MSCTKAFEDKLSLRLEDPCPAVSSGSFKVANVCKVDPIVYYTPAPGSRPQDFNESIEDIKYLDKLDTKMKRFFMTAICDLKHGVKDKTKVSTVAVGKLIPVEDYLDSHSPTKFISRYVKFINDLLREIKHYNVTDYWKFITTDFKLDNMMVNNTGRIFITDFSPLRKRSGNRWGYVATGAYLLKDNFKDYNPLNKYTDEEISIIGIKMFLLTTLTTLSQLINIAVFIRNGFRGKTAVNKSWTDLYRLGDRNPSDNLDGRINFVLNSLLGNLSPKDARIVRSWAKILQTKIGKTAPILKKAKLTAGPSVGASGPSRIGLNISKTKCQEFIKKAKDGRLKLTNPITGRQIAANGAVAKKIMKQCK